MFEKIDEFLISRSAKQTQRPPSILDKLFRNKYILMIVSLLILHRTLSHAYESYHHNHLILCFCYTLLAVLLLVANIRHHFFKRKIDLLEQGIHFTEAMLILWYGLLKVLTRIDENASAWNIIAITTGCLMLVFFYLIIARAWFLIRKGKLKNPHVHE